MNGLLEHQLFVHESGYETVMLRNEEAYEIAKNIFKSRGLDNEYKDLMTQLGTIQHLQPIDPKSELIPYSLSDRPHAYLEFIRLTDKSFAIVEPKEKKHKEIIFFENAIEFANKYGMLETPDSDPESGMTWIRQSNCMRLAQTLFQLIKNRDHDALSKIIFKKNGVYVYKDLFVLDFMENMDIISDLGIADKENYVPPFGTSVIKNEIQAAWAIISTYVTKNLIDSLTVSITPKNNYTGAEMNIIPRELFRGLWLQLANSITNNFEIKTCIECNSLYEVTKKPRRFESMYCSPKCNKRASARRRREREKANQENES